MAKLNKILLLFFAILIKPCWLIAQPKVLVIDSNTFTLGSGVVLNKTSFRGLSVVDDNTIWVSGSRGTIARSVDGGKTVSYTQLKGYEKSDFRDIEAFDAQRAIIMSSGTPAYILKTIDGGQTWKEVYKNTDTAYFLDAMDFWDDKRGMLVGDPINGHFVLLQTNDGGDTWQELDTTKTPKAMHGEAVFAASGTSLRCWGRTKFGFVSGGTRACFYFFRNYTFKSIGELDIVQGKPSTGAFSFVKYAGITVVGGDYLDSTESFSDVASHNYRFNGYGVSINKFHYLSCCEHIAWLKGFVYCGAYGVYTHSVFFPEPFHVVHKAKKGKAVFLAGPNGKIGKLVY